MRILICGDRNWENVEAVRQALKLYKGKVTAVIEGEARGADSIGRFVAEQMGIEVEPYPANWEKYKRAAGPIRNQQMLDEGKPDLVLAFHNDLNSSKGTKDMVRRARKAKVLVCVVSFVQDSILMDYDQKAEGLFAG